MSKGCQGKEKEEKEGRKKKKKKIQHTRSVTHGGRRTHVTTGCSDSH